MMYTSALEIIGVKIGLMSNNPELVKGDEWLDADIQAKKPVIWSILTALPAPTRIPYDKDSMDAFFVMIDTPDAKPDVVYEGNKCTITGDFSKWEAAEKDKRWNIYGNVGIFFEFCLITLEKVKGIHSMHASALYNPEKNLLLVVAGSSGSGKTVYQLEALLHHGYEVFTTEMTHFSVDAEGCTFYKGSTYDNIRIGNLVYDFPAAIERFSIDVPEVEDKWETYLAVNLGPWSTKETTLRNPRTVFIFPKVETGRTETIINTNPGKGGLIRSMFENAGEKIYKTQVNYGSAACSCHGAFDSQEMAQKRLDDIRALLEMDFVTDRMKMLCGPQDCWLWEEKIR